MDETREQIVKTIEAKKKATAGKLSKPENLKKQTETYVNAIAEHRAQIEKLEALVEQNKKSHASAMELVDTRTGEIEHMEEILERYDTASAELSEVSQTLLDRMNAIPDWMPGMDESLKGALKRDPQFKEALKRKDYLVQCVEACLADVKKVYNSRGVVSGFNEKGRQGV